MSAGMARTSNSPRSARPKPVSRSWLSTVARKPISPKLTAKTGTPRPANRRRAERIVPSPPITTARSVGASGSASSTAPLQLGEPVLFHLLGRHVHFNTGLRAHLGQAAQRTPPWRRGCDE